MSQRLQVLVDKKEYSNISKEAFSEKKSVSEWVRGLIRDRLSRKAEGPVADPIKALENLALPAPSIEQMLREIDEGRR